MASKIRILVYRPGEPGALEEHLNDLDTQQKLVGGYIENVNLGDGIVLTCDEEGKLKNLPANFVLPGDVVAGTAFFCRVDAEGECVSLTDADIVRIQNKIGR